MPRLASATTAATTARPSTETPLIWPRSTFHASSASRPVVAASPFIMQAPAKTSAVLASTYVPVTDAGFADIVASVSAESATVSAIFFILASPVRSHHATGAPLAARVGADRLTVGSEAGLCQH